MVSSINVLYCKHKRYLLNYPHSAMEENTDIEQDQAFIYLGLHSGIIDFVMEE